MMNQLQSNHEVKLGALYKALTANGQPFIGIATDYVFENGEVFVTLTSNDRNFLRKGTFNLKVLKIMNLADNNTLIAGHIHSGTSAGLTLKASSKPEWSYSFTAATRPNLVYIAKSSLITALTSYKDAKQKEFLEKRLEAKRKIAELISRLQTDDVDAVETYKQIVDSPRIDIPELNLAQWAKDLALVQALSNDAVEIDLNNARGSRLDVIFQLYVLGNA